MAWLRQDHHYGLSCGESSRSSAERTLYHVKLTDTAIRALEALHNLKASLSSEPSISFKGKEGYIKIPAPTSESPSAFRVFSFYLSSDNKDQPQASFDCIHQYVSSDRREQLEVQGSIQDKITVCATDDSYQMTRERMSQVEKHSWSRSAIEIEPGATQPNKYVKYQKRPAPLPIMDNSFKKQSISSRRNGGPSAASQKPLKERIIHQLALKPYSKPELLLWLEKEKAGPKDKSWLGGVLEEVAKVNPKDNSYLLQDDFYKHVQKDWPGYNKEEHQLISQLLTRKLQTHIDKQSTDLQEKLSVLMTSENQSRTKSTAVKRSLSSDLMESLVFKTQKVTDQQQQQQHAGNRLWNSEQTHSIAALIPSPSFHTKTEFERTSNHPEDQNSLLGRHNSYTQLHKLSSNSDWPVLETKEPEATVNYLQPSQGDTDCTREQLSNNQHRKKKSKKHKDEVRQRLKNDLDIEWIKSRPDIKDNPVKLNNLDITNAVPSEQKPDYVLTYVSIKSLEQRKRYLKDFQAEYDEYKELHSRIATITCMFVQLESKIKRLSPGTTEYKIMEDQILEKYNKYRKKFPGYREEKKRCEYLHEKLAYIKQCVIDYDVSRAPS